MVNKLRNLKDELGKSHDKILSDYTFEKVCYFNKKGKIAVYSKAARAEKEDTNH